MQDEHPDRDPRTAFRPTERDEAHEHQIHHTHYEGRERQRNRAGYVRRGCGGGDDRRGGEVEEDERRADDGEGFRGDVEKV